MGTGIKGTYSAVLGLGDKDPDEASLDNTPDHEDKVSLPCNIGKSDWETELVDESSSGDEHVREGHSLGTHLEGEDFDRVERLHGGPAKGVDSLEDVDH